MMNRLLANVFVLLLTLSVVGCAATNEGMVKEQVVSDAACKITDASYQHILERHCTSGSGGSQLLDKYCTRDGMQNFCIKVQNAPNKYRTVQLDNRIRYDANLGEVVGKAGEKCGRLIIQSQTNGDVVTEFPEFGNAPGNCH